MVNLLVENIKIFTLVVVEVLFNIFVAMHNCNYTGARSRVKNFLLQRTKIRVPHVSFDFRTVPD